jgi:hypothetical protein
VSVTRFELVRADVTVAFAGTTGASGGRTVTRNDLPALLPALLVAVQATVVIPTGNVAPDGGVQTTGSVPSIASVALTT